MLQLKRALMSGMVLLLISSLTIIAAPDKTSASPAAPVISSQSAILIDQRSGLELFGQNVDLPQYPASITKIATGIIALENAKLDDSVTVSKTARYEDGTRIYLAEGETLPMEKLLYGLLMNSGNDAATAIAEHIDGTKERFAERMNTFMKDVIGAKRTHFMNPSGLHDPLHYTTASDMAKLAQYAMRNEMFRKIVSTKKMPWNGQEWQSSLENHNQMLTTYWGTTGIKNGYTIAAGNTLVTSATRNGVQLIGVVLKASSKKVAYADMKALLDYGFDNYESRELYAAGETYKAADGTMYQVDEPIWAIYPKDQIPEVSVSSEGNVYVHSASGEFHLLGHMTAMKGMSPPSGGGTISANVVSSASIKPATVSKVLVVWLTACGFAAIFVSGAFVLWLRRRRASRTNNGIVG